MEAKFHPDIFLLDDGFQHARLHRDVDLVLIDGLDPLAGGELFPLGRLREPLSALRRASAFVVTRSNRACIRDVLSLWNPRAPVFESRVVPCSWADVATQEQHPPEAFRGLRVAAFCGLANPDAFWSTLASLGITPLAASAFRDHHRYTAADLKRLSSQAASLGAVALLTTEKDSINLPSDTADLIAPLKLLWLKIRIEVVNEDALLDLIVASIGTKRPGNSSL
jgi:tetraacyldisaccharide 4'-kinase